MSSLYEEVLIETRKLKEIAEEDAKKAIVEEITPFIRNLISAELSGKPTPTLFEDATPVESEPTPAPSPGLSTEQPPSTPVPGAPIQPMGTSGGDIMNMPMPDSEGKLVVDFDDLWVPVPPGTEPDAAIEDQGAVSASTSSSSPPGGLPGTEPVDVMPAPMAPIDLSAGLPPPSPLPATSPGPISEYEMFQEKLGDTAKKVHQIYEQGTAPSLVKEVLQEKLFELLESLEEMSLSTKLAHILETRLEVLHRKLQEVQTGYNTYNKTTEETIDMASKSLKEFAAKAMTESEEKLPTGKMTSPADSFQKLGVAAVTNPTEKTADKAGEHAGKVSEPTVTLQTEEVEMKKLEEELLALIAESEGTSLSTVPGKQDLAGAADSIPNKPVDAVDTTKSSSVDKTVMAAHIQSVTENSKTISVDAKALAEETKRLKAENLRKQISRLQEELSECGGGMLGGREEEMEEEGSMPTMPAMTSEEGTVVNFNFDLSDLVPELADLDDDDEIEITDDGDGEEHMVPGGGDEMPTDGTPDHAMVGHDGAEGETEEPTDTSGAGAKLVSENKMLKAKLADQQLFNAKVVHLQPFINNKNLTKEQKTKIVEHLDRGKSIEQVKTIYNNIKVVVEKIQNPKSKTGSASKPISSGAASLSTTLEDRNKLFEGAVLVETQRTRLMELAGIKK